MRADDVRAEARACPERAPDRERLRLALHLDRLQRLVVEDPVRRLVSLRRDRNAVHGRRPLQAGGGIDDVAGDDPLPLFRAGAQGDDRLARVDPNADLQRERRVFFVQLCDRLEDAEAGADGALGVVLVRDGRAKDGHDCVSDELLHGPAVALDLPSQAGVVRADAGANVLGVCRLGSCGEADDVAEEHGDDLALLLQGNGRLLGQRRTAERTEREFARELLPAGRAGRHAPSLRRLSCKEKARLQAHRPVGAAMCGGNTRAANA
jgi:hypothetical protein